MDYIEIKGARQHNLKNINLRIPKNKLVVFTGLSGSGKSSLAFETIYAEGQRRYVESLSAYARQFLGIMEKPEVDKIEGLSPAIAINQKGVSHNPRSTVGTITEVYDFLRLLFARIGHPHCPKCEREIAPQSVDQIADSVLKSNFGTRLMVLAPVVKDKKGEFIELLEKLKKQGFRHVRIDGKIYDLNDNLVLIKTNRHSIEAVVDKISGQSRARLVESVEKGLELADGEVIVSRIQDKSFSFPEKPELFEDYLFSQKYACPECGISLAEIEPRFFSFNSPHGACQTCNGLGTLLKADRDLLINPELSFTEGGVLPLGFQVDDDTWYIRLIKAVAQAENLPLQAPLQLWPEESLDILLYGTGGKKYLVKDREAVFEGVIPRMERLYSETASEWRRGDIGRFMRTEICPTCLGARLKKGAASVSIAGKNIVDVNRMSIKEALVWVKELELSGPLNQREREISEPIFKELKQRLGFLNDVGLDYLTLDRPASSLAGGEGQRINLASQVGSGLSGVVYVLDEPTVGLHERDSARLMAILFKIRDLGNTVIVVEHDRKVMEGADLIFDFGPGGGKQGGELVATGNIKEIKANKRSLTGQYLKGKKKIQIKEGKPSRTDGVLRLIGACGHNLKNINVEFPLGKFVCVTGVSGSGKSTLVLDTLYHALAQVLNRRHRVKAAKHDGLIGYENISRVSLIDQSPIGRTPRSNPATYTKSFDYMRQLMAQSRQARIRGYKPGRFSFNVSGGRCESCRGEGQNKVEMQFLPPVWVNCEVCQGKRYNQETLNIQYKEKNIFEILKMTVEEALAFFPGAMGPLRNRLETLYDVGLGYIELGQPAPTLSGGEAQRVKLAAELAKSSKGHTLYLLDEPTTGLHFHDLKKLLIILKRLVERNNTVVVIEHNLEVVKNADWVIDLGPEGGEEGGYLMVQGAPQEVAKAERSYTGRFLKKMILV